MIKKVFYILILIFYSLNVNSQIQKNFFVDDANGVDFLRINFCVNNDAKINKVTVLEGESTYSNEYVINQLKDYLLSIEYYPDSKLKNNCYDTTFTFINSKYESQEVENNDGERNFQFLTGRYQYKDPLYGETNIKRGKRIQREIGIKDKQIYFIKWISDVHYKLVYKRMTEKRLKKLIGNEIDVKILDILPDNSYVFRSTVEHNDRITYGVIKKVE